MLCSCCCSPSRPRHATWDVRGASESEEPFNSTSVFPTKTPSTVEMPSRSFRTLFEAPGTLRKASGEWGGASAVVGGWQSVGLALGGARARDTTAAKWKLTHFYAPEINSSNKPIPAPKCVLLIKYDSFPTVLFIQC